MSSQKDSQLLGKDSPPLAEELQNLGSPEETAELKAKATPGSQEKASHTRISGGILKHQANSETRSNESETRNVNKPTVNPPATKHVSAFDSPKYDHLRVKFLSSLPRNPVFNFYTPSPTPIVPVVLRSPPMLDPSTLAGLPFNSPTINLSTSFAQMVTATPNPGGFQNRILTISNLETGEKEDAHTDGETLSELKIENPPNLPKKRDHTEEANQEPMKRPKTEDFFRPWEGQNDSQITSMNINEKSPKTTSPTVIEESPKTTSPSVFEKSPKTTKGNGSLPKIVGQDNLIKSPKTVNDIEMIRMEPFPKLHFCADCLNQCRQAITWYKKLGDQQSRRISSFEKLVADRDSEINAMRKRMQDMEEKAKELGVDLKKHD